MIIKTKYGSEIETDDFKGYGEFKKYVQSHFDKDWGKSTQKETKTYTVTFVGTANVYARKEIEAYNEEDAKGQAKKMLKDLRSDEFDWEMNCYSDVDNIDIDDVECDEDEEDDRI